MGRPFHHDFPPLREKVRALVGKLGIVTERMSEARFDNLAREVRLLSCPITERRAKTVYGAAIIAETAQQLQHRHVGEREA